MREKGWICPKCGRVNAPWMPTCGCVSSQTRGTPSSGTPYLVEISSISRDSHEIAKTEQSSMVGEWVKSKIPNELYVCSECGGACWSYDYERNIVKSNYCPNCGAKMKG